MRWTRGAGLVAQGVYCATNSEGNIVRNDARAGRAGDGVADVDVETLRTQKSADFDDIVDSGEIVLVAATPIRREFARAGPDVRLPAADHEEVMMLLAEEFRRVAPDIDEPEPVCSAFGRGTRANFDAPPFSMGQLGIAINVQR